ncbi:hypothetical protein WJX74_008968 [Apatococcus lobatus]|uniref:Uncharacterized protein n=1 Tax=Apatococcus lobatus TaxID=904363 RepID=A0AAW1RSR5_9CHLO
MMRIQMDCELRPAFMQESDTSVISVHTDVSQLLVDFLMLPSCQRAQPLVLSSFPFPAFSIRAMRLSMWQLDQQSLASFLMQLRYGIDC